MRMLTEEVRKKGGGEGGIGLGLLSSFEVRQFSLESWGGERKGAEANGVRNHGQEESDRPGFSNEHFSCCPCV